MNLIIFSAITGVILMMSGLFIKNKQTISSIAIACFLLLSALNHNEMFGSSLFHFNVHGMVQFDRFGLLINQILLLSAAIWALLQARDIEKIGDNVAEYYALIFFVFCGIGIVTAYQTLLMLFIGIEIISIPLYILTASNKLNLKSNEAGLKYFLMGAFSTGIMLMGIAFVYGATGTFFINKIALIGTDTDGLTQVEIFRCMGGLILLMVSISFKISAAPFHFWAPDVYDGAPTPFTAFMATIVKVAALIAFLKLFDGNTAAFYGKWKPLLSIIIACTLLIGNITAVFQQSVKRMLAYSSIAQAGFMLFVLFTFTGMAKEAVVLYAAAYSLATIGIFSILNRMDDYTFEDYNGLGKSEPMLATFNTIFFLSLVGIPLTAGFFAKYYAIASALQNNGKYLWLFIIAMLCAAISAYYYFRVIQAMYFKTGDGQKISATPIFKLGLCAIAVLIIVIGINPQWLLQWLYF